VEMSESIQPVTHSTLRRVFYGRSELRAGWRLAIFLPSRRSNRRKQSGAPSTFDRRGRCCVLSRSRNDRLPDIPFCYLDHGRIEKKTTGDYGLPWRKMFRGQFWQGVLLGFASVTILLLAMHLAGVFYWGTVALRGADIWKWAITYALVFILVALREEFRARGYALYTLSAGIGFWPAAILTAAYFGYSHHSHSGEDWIGLVNAGLFGLFACLLLRRTGNLWMPIGVHTAFDWCATYFYGVADSGQVLPGHLLNSSFSGPAWLSGGTVGPEGSLLCTLLLLALWLVCAAWLREAKYPGQAKCSGPVTNASNLITRSRIAS
jgi:membrane protease YdiL (CAAX protease family)